MHICHLTSVHQRYDTRILHKECASLARSGFQVTLIVADGKPEETIQDVHIISACTPESSRVRRIWNSSRAVYQEALRQDADIYHLHDPELLPFALDLKKRGKKVIFDSHEDVPLDILTKEWIPAGLRHLISFSYENYEKHVIKGIDAVITVTPHIAERFQRYTHHVHMITNYPGTTESLKKRSRPSPDTPLKICFAGRIAPLWQHEIILDAMSLLPECTYLLAGPISKDYKEKLQKKPTWDKVQFRGILTRAEVFSMFEECHIGIALLDYIISIGGKRGSLGVNKLFEYMSAGLPLICTDLLLWQEIIDKWSCGIAVPANSHEKLAEAISHIYNHPDIALKMGEQGVLAIQEEYNWDSQEQKLLKLYKHVLSEI